VRVRWPPRKANSTDRAQITRPFRWRRPRTRFRAGNRHRSVSLTPSPLPKCSLSAVASARRLRLGSLPGQRRSQAWNLIGRYPNSRDTLLSRDASRLIVHHDDWQFRWYLGSRRHAPHRYWAHRRSRVFVNRRPSHLTAKNFLPEDLHLTAHLAGLSCIHQRSSRRT
jgi:hypothetical protein